MIITFAVSCNIFHNIEHQTVVTVCSGFYFENITCVETTYSGGGHYRAAGLYTLVLALTQKSNVHI